MKYPASAISKIVAVIFVFQLSGGLLFSQSDSIQQKKYPVVLDKDTLFYLSERVGISTAEQRANEINTRLEAIAANDTLVYDSINVIKQGGYLLLYLKDNPIMAVSKADAEAAGTGDSILAHAFRKIMTGKLNEMRTRYSQKSLINNGIYSLLYLAILILFLWLLTKVFPWIYSKIMLLESIKLRSIKFREKEIMLSLTITKIILLLAKGFRFALSLFAVYLFITKTIELWPYTRKLDIQPIIKSIVLLIFYSALFYAIFRSINSLVRLNLARYKQWKGTKIKSIKIKAIEILPVERLIDFLKFLTRVIHFVLTVVIFYTYLTIIFSLFSFSETWAKTLLNYILDPLKIVGSSLLNFLPNLFFIIVLILLFYYLIKAVKFLFLEIDKGALVFPGFHMDWAMPTYKIVRFLILVLAAIVIFPYLPGSDSPFFQGISVFLGVLFSLGSSSAIANMVAGLVITYMRPFKIGDRVKIADTVGDVVEKTLLVTRVRTVKNVDITVPNSMVLGSHIINYSSSAEDKGLILHTTVTIGYDVSWRKIHDLLISAAEATGNILKEPKPFVLQTALNDFYVSYELNAYTKNPQNMLSTYSELHSKIHDKFDEAGVEIMSPHYNAIRDGNETTVPSEYLPKGQSKSQPNLFGSLFGDKPERE